MLSRRGRLVFSVIGFVLLAAGVAGFALRVYMHLSEGQATDTYDNVYGFHISWSQAAAFLVSVPVILLGIYVVGRWQLWRRSRQEGASQETIRKELKRNL